MTKKHFLVALMLSPLFLAACGGGSNPEPSADEPLGITCTAGNMAEIKYSCVKTGSTGSLPKLEYSLDKTNWKKVTIKETSDSPEKIETIKEGQTIYFRGSNENGFNYYDANNSVIFKFVSDSEKYSKKFKISGNIMSLLFAKDYANKKEIPCDGCFYDMFSTFGASSGEVPQGIVDASDLLLPATTLTRYAYAKMFGATTGVTTILKAPKDLPATVAADDCYYEMFSNAKCMVTAPVISLNKLSNRSCSNMFYYCQSLAVIDVEKDGKIKFFTCPSTDGLTNPVDKMFSYTEKWKTDVTPEVGKSYWYNI